MDKQISTLIDRMREANQVNEFDWKKAVAGGLAAASLAAGPMSADAATLGQKNNNPINLKAFDKWDGMTGKDSYGHAIFSDLDHGIRASYKNLANHARKHPDQTLKEYLKTFAEANQGEEAEFIAKEMSIPSSTALKEINISQLLVAMAKFESKMKLDQAEVDRVKVKFNLGGK